MPSIKIELRDEKGKLITADSVEGEIHVQSPSVMLGYYNNPEASSAALTNDRWLRTGDWGYKKGSLYFISSRRTDLILRGAENVYPQEIELILDSHKDIEESADSSISCLLYTSPSPRDATLSRMPSSA